MVSIQPLPDKAYILVREDGKKTDIINTVLSQTVVHATKRNEPEKRGREK